MLYAAIFVCRCVDFLGVGCFLFVVSQDIVWYIFFLFCISIFSASCWWWYLNHCCDVWCGLLTYCSILFSVYLDIIVMYSLFRSFRSAQEYVYVYIYRMYMYWICMCTSSMSASSFVGVIVSVVAAWSVFCLFQMYCTIAVFVMLVWGGQYIHSMIRTQMQQSIYFT